MIIVRLMGGLGNQLFQYALGRSLAQRSGASIKFDRFILDVDPLREYGLDCFNIQVSFATPGEVARFTDQDTRGLGKWLHYGSQRLKPYYRRKFVVERSPIFDPAILKIRQDAYLIGYWLSEKYFKEIEDDLRDELTFKNPPDPDNQAVLQQIESTQAVSLHIRRTDYLTNPKVRRVLRVCSLEYYHDAVEEIAKRVNQPKFFVFSDDIYWTKENLRIPSPTIFVDLNNGKRDYEDLRLISHCKHHIIANSSFSWWGAWLSRHPGKVVFAPRYWYRNMNRDTRDLLPRDWIQI